MKNKKLIIIVSLIIVVIVGIVSFILILNSNNTKYKDELKKQEEINDKYIKISEKINSIINDKIKPIEEVINKDIGDDKTKIDELNNKKEELSKYLIIINGKKIADLNKLKEENEKLENSLKNIDENLINLNEEEIQNYTISEEHQINVISKEIAKLIEEINTLAIKQENVKCENQLLKGDFSCYVGVYKDMAFSSDYTLEIDKDGNFIEKFGSYEYQKYFKKIEKQKDGSYNILTKGDIEGSYYMFLPGVSDKHFNNWGVKTDKTKVRIFNCTIACEYYYQKD